jgi:hypothetical protein
VVVMGQARARIQRRKKAREQLAVLFDRADQVLIIHYSCESFYDRQDGASPRITSIAIRNLASGQTTSFSIHQMAERQNVSKDAIEQQYDTLERLMLDEFYEYIHLHGSHTWLHWNMRDINYGFQALAHRYRVLGGQPLEIHDSKLVDLSRLLYTMYGSGYIGHPRLQKLLEKNHMAHQDLLPGAEEAAAFTRKEYVKLHQSTLRKVDTFETIAERTHHGFLKTNSTWRQTLRDYPEALGELLQQHWLATTIGFVSAVAGIVTIILAR